MQLNNTPKRHTFILAIDKTCSPQLVTQFVAEEMATGRVPVDMGQISQIIYESSKGVICKAIIDYFPDGYEEVIYPEDWPENKISP